MQLRLVEPARLQERVREVGVGGGPPFLTSPLLGLDAYEPFVSSALPLSVLNLFNAGQRGLEPDE